MVIYDSLNHRISVELIKKKPIVFDVKIGGVYGELKLHCCPLVIDKKVICITAPGVDSDSWLLNGNLCSVIEKAMQEVIDLTDN